MGRRIQSRQKHERKKIGRNEPCPCGSGLKFKKCCLTKAKPIFTAVRECPPGLREKAMRIFDEQRRREQERVARFGEIRPQISAEFQGQRLVVVRNKIFYSDKW